MAAMPFRILIHENSRIARQYSLLQITWTIQAMEDRENPRYSNSTWTQIVICCAIFHTRAFILTFIVAYCSHQVEEKYMICRHNRLYRSAACLLKDAVYEVYQAGTPLAVFSVLDLKFSTSVLYLVGLHLQSLKRRSFAKIGSSSWSHCFT